ncbi:hypothetical protein B0H13DRAFT_2320636 [Mycena leptocephala]|nr:hypothetical protein B0H13DRAFT_2320636 [Mycena leptocephala]
MLNPPGGRNDSVFRDSDPGIPNRALPCPPRAVPYRDQTLQGGPKIRRRKACWGLDPNERRYPGLHVHSYHPGKGRLMKKYVNTIREERTGRDIHHKRFFLKVDDVHKMRIKILAKQMTEGVVIRDALEARAMALHLETHPAKDWMHDFQATVDEGGEETGLDGIISYIRRSENKLRQERAVNADDDLIMLKLRS